MSNAELISIVKQQQLCNDYGYESIDKMLEATILDSCVPAICMNKECDYSTEMEPGQDAGWCECCESNTVVSCLVLAGLI
jgi:hypothetical protein